MRHGLAKNVIVGALLSRGPPRFRVLAKSRPGFRRCNVIPRTPCFCARGNVSWQKPSRYTHILSPSLSLHSLATCCYNFSSRRTAKSAKGEIVWNARGLHVDRSRRHAVEKFASDRYRSSFPLIREAPAPPGV